MNDSKLWRGILIGLLLATVALSIWNISISRAQPDGLNLFAPISEVYKLIKQHFYKPSEAEEKELIYGAIRGMLQQLDDPYSRFLEPEQYKRFNDSLEGEFVGVGIKISVEEGKLTVIAPLKDSPASKAGIKAADRILEIDGESTEGITLEEAVNKIRGERGTPVKLKVQHEEGTIEEFTLIRDVIKVETVEHRMLDKKIGYVSISSFNRQTAQELQRALDELDKAGLRGLILDLRDNPGGLLNVAVDVASLFIDSGLILKSQSRYGAQEYATKGNQRPNLPMAVLINKGTASASEIVAGAIADHQMGILVGRRSFGKGVIQTSYTLQDNSALILTTAEYFTPKGRRVQRDCRGDSRIAPCWEGGLIPDITVDKEENDLKIAQRWVEAHLGRLCPCPFQNAKSQRFRVSLHSAWFTE